MRKFVYLLALIVLMVAPTWGQSSFTVRPGVYLWHVWVNPPYHEHFPDWAAFCKQVADLNGLPNADAAFRTLQSGDVLELPPLPGTVEKVEKELTEKIRRQEEARVAKRIAELEEEKRKLESKGSGVGWGGITWSLWADIFVLTTLAGAAFAIYVLFSVYPRVETLQAENGALRDGGDRLIAENEAYKFYLRRYTLPFDIPVDIGRVPGTGQRVFLPFADRINGDEAVLVYLRGGRFQPMKVKNLLRYFDEADIETLKFYGIVPNPARPVPQPT